jgi:hypothetical protein
VRNTVIDQIGDTSTSLDVTACRVEEINVFSSTVVASLSTCYNSVPSCICYKRR